MSSPRDHLRSRPLVTDHIHIGHDSDEFPTDVVWVGLKGSATKRLIPCIFGTGEWFETNRHTLQETLKYLNCLPELERPKAPMIADGDDVDKVSIEPKLSIRRVLPDSTDISSVTGATPEDTRRFAQISSERFLEDGDVEVDVFPETDGVVRIFMNIQFGVHDVKSIIPVFTDSPTDEERVSAYESVHFPIPILTSDSSMKSEHTRSRTANGTLHTFQIPE